jgi:hypothetical protein
MTAPNASSRIDEFDRPRLPIDGLLAHSILASEGDETIAGQNNRRAAVKQRFAIASDPRTFSFSETPNEVGGRVLVHQNWSKPYGALTALSIIDSSSPSALLFEQASRRTRARLAMRRDVQLRLAELKAYGSEDDLPWSTESERDFLKFIDEQAEIRRPHLFLVDNGNLRAVWKGAAGEQVGIQFRGSGVVQYVAFARSMAPPMMSRSSGRCGWKMLERILVATNTMKLLKECR